MQTAPPLTPQINDSTDPKETIVEVVKEQKQECAVGFQLQFRKDYLNIAKTVKGDIVVFEKRNMCCHFK